jgi:hypothetical protein
MKNPGIVTVLALCAFADVAALELEDVLDRTAIEPPTRVRFQEQRYNPLFEEPLQLTGLLEYPVAGELRKVIESPFQETFTVNADKIQILQQGEVRDVPLSQSRALRKMFVGFEAILAGDTSRIEQEFTWTLAGDAGDWSLHLVPRSRRVAKYLASITVTGDVATIRTIRTDLSDDEWQLMTISRNEDES